MTCKARLDNVGAHRSKQTHVLQEDLQDTSGLLVDEARDTLDASTASQTADSGLGNTWLFLRQC